jgi:hypothetical protein
LIETVEKYNITAENLYNWDEKGFLLGLARTLKRIMTLNAYKKGLIMGASHDGSREFLSLLACICADGTKLPPLLIYQGDSHDLQDSWVQDFNEGDQAYFATTANGWSCDQLGLEWLQKVFHLQTKSKAGNRRWLLIVDGHSSHVNLKFIEWADQHRIILLILPPHSTHRLQPLDVSLFSPLATAYSNQITKLMSDSYGLVSMSKREFWPLFKVAWETSFTMQNINSGFSKTGIWPYNPDMVLSRIRPVETLPVPALANQTPSTPMTCRSVRRIHKAYQKEPTTQLFTFIMHANLRLAASNSIAQHTIGGLVNALKMEKKKRNRGKRLNLVKEEANGPQVFTPNQVHRAKAYANELKAQEQTERARIDTNKATALDKRLQKEAERAAQALQTSIRRQETAERKAQKAAEVQARKEQREAAKQAREAQKAQKTTKKSDLKRKEAAVVPPESSVVADVVGSLVKVTSKGRAVKQPAKLST